jgi:hypothetical protein
VKYPIQGWPGHFLLEWTLAGDNLEYCKYTEKVDQTFAHYYYFKVTSVSIWGKESDTGSITKIRVPATTPPQTPSMLRPPVTKREEPGQLGRCPSSFQIHPIPLYLPKSRKTDLYSLQTASQNVYKNLFQNTSVG